MLKKVQSCQNNPEKSYAEKKARHEPSGWSTFIRCSFDEKENKLDHNRGKDCIEKLCKKLKERIMEIINFKKKDMIPLTNKEILSLMKNKKYVVYVKKGGFEMMIKTKQKSEVITTIPENLEELLIANAV